MGRWVAKRSGLRRDPHERHPLVPLRAALEGTVLRSVANLTWADGREFVAVAAGVPVRTQVTTFPLDEANEALAALRGGGVNGAIVLQVAT